MGDRERYGRQREVWETVRVRCKFHYVYTVLLLNIVFSWALTVLRFHVLGELQIPMLKNI